LEILTFKGKHLFIFPVDLNEKKRYVMKKREKIMGINEHSKGRIVREKLWYFSEENADSSNSVKEVNDLEKPDSYSKIIRGRNDHLTPRSIGRNRFKRDNAFVVDWQLSDSL